MSCCLTRCRYQDGKNDIICTILPLFAAYAPLPKMEPKTNERVCSLPDYRTPQHCYGLPIVDLDLLHMEVHWMAPVVLVHDRQVRKGRRKAVGRRSRKEGNWLYQ